MKKHISFLKSIVACKVANQVLMRLTMYKNNAKLRLFASNERFIAVQCKTNDERWKKNQTIHKMSFF